MSVSSRDPFLKKTDRALLLLCLLGLIFTGAILESDTLFYRLFGSSETTSKTEQIGWISSYSHDTRHKSFGSLAWNKAKSEDPVHVGDSVFTAANSQATVRLKNDDQVLLGQNSMITFRSVNNIEVPDFSVGNFSLHVKGTMTIAVNGQVRELEGDNAQVQIFVKHGHQVIRTVKGKVLIGDNHGFKKLVSETVVPAKGEVPDENADAIPELSTAPYVHVWQVGDFYSQVGSAIQARAAPRAWVNLVTSVSWLLVGSPQSVYGELSEDPKFSLVKDTFRANPRDLHAQFHTAHLGENFVHLSVDHTHWSAPQSFRVLTSFLNQAPPQIMLANSHIYLLGDSTATTLHLQGGQSFIVEMTRDSTFSPANTHVVWLAANGAHSGDLKIQITNPGVYFFRARNIGADEQVSDLSSPISVVVERPLLPQAPILSSNEIHMVEGEHRLLTWPSSDRANSYAVHIVNVVKNSSTDITLSEPALQLAPKKPGIYDLQIASIDRFNRHSTATSTVRLMVTPRPILQAPPLASPREPAQDQSVIMTYLPAQTTGLNEAIFLSHFDFEFGEVSMYSRDLASITGQIPEAAVAGVHWLNWFGANGVEGNFYSKVADMSVPSGAGFSSYDFEVRYERRWRPTISLSDFFEPLQVAFVTGVEVYQNTSSGYFSPGYTLAKVGAALDLPISERVSAGGEFLYGENSDSTNLYEGSLYGSYFYRKNWSLGLGYRVQLMNAGSTHEAPTQLPYREGASEAYTVLKWFY